MSNTRLLILGSIPHEGKGKTIGGTTVLMQSFLDYCRANSIDHLFIQSNKYLGIFSSLRNAIFLLGSLLVKIKSSNFVMINASIRGAMYISPAVYSISKLYKKKIMLRRFGGNFHKQYMSSSKWKKKILSMTILSADILFFETLEMVEFFRKRVTNPDRVHWFPNVREKPKIEKSANDFNFRFVFISQIKKTKGIYEIIKASNSLPKKYSIDIYGPIMEDDISANDFRNSNVNYKGILSPEKVLETLVQYDVLLLPTYYPGEGYPGIIIEAFSIGIPVISTNWNAIPEIVQNEYNGFLIEPENVNELYKAIVSFTKENYYSFCENSKSSFEKFHDEKVYREVIETMNLS